MVWQPATNTLLWDPAGRVLKTSLFLQPEPLCFATCPLVWGCLVHTPPNEILEGTQAWRKQPPLPAVSSLDEGHEHKCSLLLALFYTSFLLRLFFFFFLFFYSEYGEDVTPLHPLPRPQWCPHWNGRRGSLQISETLIAWFISGREMSGRELSTLLTVIMCNIFPHSP